MLLWNNNKADLRAAAVVNGVEQSNQRIQERYHYIDECNSFPHMENKSKCWEDSKQVRLNSAFNENWWHDQYHSAK